MTVASKVVSVVYPVVGGAGAALAARVALQAGRRFVFGNSKTPSDRGSGGTAWMWTVVSWTVPAGVGLYAGQKLVRSPSTGPALQRSAGTAVAERQPAQS